MTTVAPATRRAVLAPRRPVRASTRRPRPPLRVAPVGTTSAGATQARARRGRAGAALVLVTVFALVTVVLFHVMLASGQLRLDRLNLRIGRAQREYEQLRLETSRLASPERILQEAQRLGLAVPAEPARYLRVPDAPLLSADGNQTANTLEDWTKVKSHLGDQQP